MLTLMPKDLGNLASGADAAVAIGMSNANNTRITSFIDSDVANDPPSSANTAVPAGFAWLLSRAKGALTT
jgi:hypothetical protein